MAITSLNMTEVSREVFPSLISEIGPILSNSFRVENNPFAKTTSVNVFGERTGAEFTQSTGSYTATAAATTAIDVTFTEVYDYMTMNKLSFLQSPVDVVMGLLPTMGNAIANKMFAMQNALVTTAFTNTKITSTAANWDADDLADAATTLSTTKTSKSGRYAVLEPAYYGALSKDNAIQAAYAFGDDGVIKRNVIESVHGFGLHMVPAVADSADVANMVGWVAGPEAFAVGFRPSFESAEVPTYASMGTYTDPNFGITITTRLWDGNDGNYHLWAGVGFGIARGRVTALTAIVSA